MRTLRLSSIQHHCFSTPTYTLPMYYKLSPQCITTTTPPSCTQLTASIRKFIQQHPPTKPTIKTVYIKAFFNEASLPALPHSFRSVEQPQTPHRPSSPPSPKLPFPVESPQSNIIAFLQPILLTIQQHTLPIRNFATNSITANINTVT